MASAASPSTADPKMADLCNHTTQAYSSDGCTEDGYVKRPIQPNIDGDIWSGGRRHPMAAMATPVSALRQK